MVAMLTMSTGIKIVTVLILVTILCYIISVLKDSVSFKKLLVQTLILVTLLLTSSGVLQGNETILLITKIDVTVYLITIAVYILDSITKNKDGLISKLARILILVDTKIK